jgi:hypothetical protein
MPAVHDRGRGRGRAAVLLPAIPVTAILWWSGIPEPVNHES